eukprot:CAMPEP_0172327852 /NCGR_PEP_ID=MMETSP1058-20130122/60043_1 /TAXON_ID=83371 /ORGANISM="Detonula confervacea, Strain CCMP 353" /LENGTH=445 /DNA_ID=CAMNT_0013044937 /DNA_START=1661 /DNA_END=3000 /DNA_ORIENTATION=-
MMVAAFGESLALSHSMGLDGDRMLEMFGQGVCASCMIKGSKMLKKDHTQNFRAQHAHKDTKLAVDMAEEAGTEYTVTELLLQARGDADVNVAEQDFSAVFESIHKESKSEFSKKDDPPPQPLSTRLDSETNTMAPIGFIGLGIMGEGMAGCLISAGVAGTDDVPLVVWNRTSSKCDDLKERYPDKNIEVKGSAEEVVERCGLIFSILSTPEASKAVFEADNGTLAGVSDGKFIVDCATLAESDMKRMNDQVKAKGGQFLEAPVSGSKGPAANGQLIFLCAGSESIFQDATAQSSFDAMGKATHFFGNEVGRGTRAKLVVNSLMGTMMAAFGESLALSESVGLDGDKMLEIFGQGVCASPLYSLKGSKMLKKDHAPNFPLQHAHKDMKLAVDMANEAGTAYSVTEAAEQLFKQARGDADLNVAEQDFSAVFESIHKESKSEFSKKR